jgi:hypothetical protein
MEYANVIRSGQYLYISGKADFIARYDPLAVSVETLAFRSDPESYNLMFPTDNPE